MRKLMLLGMLLGCLIQVADGSQSQTALHQKITPSNANQIEVVGQLGQGHVLDLIWTSDERYLIVATTIGLWWYDITAPSTPPEYTPQDFDFVAELILEPGGTQLIAVGAKEALLWDVETREVLGRNDITMLRLHAYPDPDDPDYWAGFDAEGRALLALLKRPGMPVIDLRTGEIVYRIDADADRPAITFDSSGRMVIHTEDTSSPIDPDDSIRGSHNLSPDGRYRVHRAGEDRQDLYIWDRMEGRDVWMMPLEPQERLDFLMWSSDSQRFAFGTDDGTYVWNGTSKDIMAYTSAYLAREPVFSSDGRVLFSGQQVWFIETETDPVEISDFGISMLWYIAISPMGRWGAVFTMDNWLHIYNLATGAEWRTILYPGPISSLMFSPDGVFLAGASETWLGRAGGSRDRSVRVWDLDTGMEVGAFQGEIDRVMSLDFSPDGRYVLAGAWWEEVARLWDVETGAARGVIETNGYHITGVAFSPNGQQIATINNATGLEWVSNPLSIAQGQMGSLEGTASRSLSFSPDGRFLASESTLYDAVTHEPILQLLGHQNVITRLAFSPDGTLLATGSGDGTARLWNLHTGTTRAIWRVHHIHPYYWADVEVAFSPDGLLLAVGGAQKLMLIEVATGQILIDIPLENTLLGLAFSPDGTLLATSGSYGTVQLWGMP